MKKKVIVGLVAAVVLVSLSPLLIREPSPRYEAYRELIDGIPKLETILNARPVELELTPAERASGIDIGFAVFSLPPEDIIAIYLGKKGGMLVVIECREYMLGFTEPAGCSYEHIREQSIAPVQ